MGQITNVVSLHLLKNKSSNSFWYADYNFFSLLFKRDFLIYYYLRSQTNLKYNVLKRKHFYQIEILKSYIYRTQRCIILNLKLAYLKIECSKKKDIRQFIKYLLFSMRELFDYKTHSFLISYKIGKLTANFAALQIGTLLEKRITFKSKVIEKYIKKIVSCGIRVSCKGRLNFVDRAKKDKIIFGSVPLQTISANIDYGFIVANTPKGLQSIKVWIFHVNKKKE